MCFVNGWMAEWMDGRVDDSRVLWNVWLNGFMRDERSLDRLTEMDRCVFFRLACLDLLPSRFSFLDGTSPRMPKLRSFVFHG